MFGCVCVVECAFIDGGINVTFTCVIKWNLYFRCQDSEYHYIFTQGGSNSFLLSLSPWHDDQWSYTAKMCLWYNTNILFIKMLFFLSQMYSAEFINLFLEDFTSVAESTHSWTIWISRLFKHQEAARSRRFPLKILHCFLLWKTGIFTCSVKSSDTRFADFQGEPYCLYGFLSTFPVESVPLCNKVSRFLGPEKGNTRISTSSLWLFIVFL